MKATAAERLMGSVLKSPSGCWLWTRPLHAEGYGEIRVNYRLHRAHRLAYEVFVGPVPEGLVLDHLCRVRHCINPEHLEPVTNAENIRRGTGYSARNAAKTACIHGHPFTGGNLAVARDRPDRNDRRVCRTCARAAQWRFRYPELTLEQSLAIAAVAQEISPRRIQLVKWLAEQERVA